MNPTGFSIATLSQFARANRIKKTAAFALSSHLEITFSAEQHFNEYCLVATLERYVQGGKAIIISHCPAIVCVCVKRLESAITVKKWQHISLDMPFGMPP